jgi:ABC-type amino acid transport substrate-binding protein
VFMKFLPVHLLILMLTFSLTCEAVACREDSVANPKTTPLLILPKAKPSSWEQESYYHDLLRLILKRTEAEFGPCDIEQTEHMLTRMRSAALISRDLGVDLFWGTTTAEREALLHPIRIPLLKGLMGQKILLIHRDDQAVFSAVKTLDDLKNLRAGQGADWPDVEIFLHHKIPVVVSANYESLYKMLAAKRFDFFPRGSNQILSELRHNAEINIAVEKDLVLVYPAPLYFFVKKGNDQLARRIEKGLREMMADGSYDRYFYQHPLIVDAILNLRLQERRVIRITNPLLPTSIPPEKPEDWMAGLKKHNPELFSQEKIAAP